MGRHSATSISTGHVLCKSDMKGPMNETAVIYSALPLPSASTQSRANINYPLLLLLLKFEKFEYRTVIG